MHSNPPRQQHLSSFHLLLNKQTSSLHHNHSSISSIIDESTFSNLKTFSSPSKLTNKLFVSKSKLFLHSFLSIILTDDSNYSKHQISSILNDILDLIEQYFSFDSSISIYSTYKIYCLYIKYMINIYKDKINEQTHLKLLKLNSLTIEFKVGIIESYLQCKDFSFFKNHKQLLYMIFKEVIDLLQMGIEANKIIRLLLIILAILNNKEDKFIQNNMISYLRNNCKLLTIVSNILMTNIHNVQIEMLIRQIFLFDKLLTKEDISCMFKLIQWNCRGSFPYANSYSNVLEELASNRNILVIREKCGNLFKILLKSKGIYEKLYSLKLSFIKEIHKYIHDKNILFINLSIYYFSYLTKYRNVNTKNKFDIEDFDNYLTTIIHSLKYICRDSDTDTIKLLCDVIYFPAFNEKDENGIINKCQLVLKKSIEKDKMNYFMELFIDLIEMYPKTFMYKYLSHIPNGIIIDKVSQNKNNIETIVFELDKNIDVYIKDKNINIIIKHLHSMKLLILLKGGTNENECIDLGSINNLYYITKSTTDNILEILKKLIMFIIDSDLGSQNCTICEKIFEFIYFFFTNVSNCRINEYTDNIIKTSSFIYMDKLFDYILMIKNDKKGFMLFVKYTFSLLHVFMNIFSEFTIWNDQLTNIFEIIGIVIKENENIDVKLLNDIFIVLISSLRNLSINDNKYINEYFFSKRYLIQLIQIYKGYTHKHIKQLYFNYKDFVSLFYYLFSSLFVDYYISPLKEFEYYELFYLITEKEEFNLTMYAYEEILQIQLKLLQHKILKLENLEKIIEKTKNENLENIDEKAKNEHLENLENIFKKAKNENLSIISSLLVSDYINILLNNINEYRKQNSKFNKVNNQYTQINHIYLTLFKTLRMFLELCDFHLFHFIFKKEFLLFQPLLLETIEEAIVLIIDYQNISLLEEIVSILFPIIDNDNDNFQEIDIQYVKCSIMNSSYQRILKKIMLIIFKFQFSSRTEDIITKFFTNMNIIIKIIHQEKMYLEYIMINWINPSFLKEKIFELKIITNNIAQRIYDITDQMEIINDEVNKFYKKNIKHNDNENNIYKHNNTNFLLIEKDIAYAYDIELENDELLNEPIIQLNDIENLNIFQTYEEFEPYIHIMKTANNINKGELEIINIDLCNAIIRITYKFIKEYLNTVVNDLIDLLNIDETICFKYTKVGILILLSKIIIQSELYERIKQENTILNYAWKTLSEQKCFSQLPNSFILKILDFVSTYLVLLTRSKSFIEHNMNICNLKFFCEEVLPKYKEYSIQVTRNFLEFVYKIIPYNNDYIIQNHSNSFKLLFNNIYEDSQMHPLILSQLLHIALIFKHHYNNDNNIINSILKSYLIDMCCFIIMFFEELKKDNKSNDLNELFYLLVNVLTEYSISNNKILFRKCFIKSPSNPFCYLEHFLIIIKKYINNENIITNTLIIFSEMYKNITKNDLKNYKEIIIIIFDIINSEINNENIIFTTLNILLSFLESDNLLLFASNKENIESLFKRFQTYLHNQNITIKLIDNITKLLNVYLNTIFPSLIKKDRIINIIEQCLDNHIVNINVLEHLEKLIRMLCDLMKDLSLTKQLFEIMISDRNNENILQCENIHFIIRTILYLWSFHIGLPFNDNERFTTFIINLMNNKNNINELIMNEYLKILFKLYECYLYEANNKNKQNKETIKSIIIRITLDFLEQFKSIFNFSNIQSVLEILTIFIYNSISFELTFPLFNSLLNAVFKNIRREEAQSTFLRKLDLIFDNMNIVSSICYDSDCTKYEMIIQTINNCLNNLLDYYKNTIYPKHKLDPIFSNFTSIVKRICFNNIHFTNDLSIIIKNNKSISINTFNQFNNNSFRRNTFQYKQLISSFKNQRFSIIDTQPTFSIDENNIVTNKTNEFFNSLQNIFSNKERYVMLPKEHKERIVQYLSQEMKVYIYNNGKRYKRTMNVIKDENDDNECYYVNITNNEISIMYVPIKELKEVKEGIEGNVFYNVSKKYVLNKKNCFVMVFRNDVRYENVRGKEISIERIGMDNENGRDEFISCLKDMIKGTEGFPRKEIK